jgi:hypothetical protein
MSNGQWLLRQSVRHLIELAGHPEIVADQRTVIVGTRDPARLARHPAG